MAIAPEDHIAQAIEATLIPLRTADPLGTSVLRHAFEIAQQYQDSKTFSVDRCQLFVDILHGPADDAADHATLDVLQLSPAAATLEGWNINRHEWHIGSERDLIVGDLVAWRHYPSVRCSAKLLVSRLALRFAQDPSFTLSGTSAADRASPAHDPLVRDFREFMNNLF